VDGAYPMGSLVPMPDGSVLRTPGPFHPSLGRTPSRPAPRLGEHTAAVLAELAGG